MNFWCLLYLSILQTFIYSAGCWINHLYKNVIKYPYTTLVYIISILWQLAIYIASENTFLNVTKKYSSMFFFRCIKILDDIDTHKRFIVFIFKYWETTKIIKFFSSQFITKNWTLEENMLLSKIYVFHCKISISENIYRYSFVCVCLK